MKRALLVLLTLLLLTACGGGGGMDGRWGGGNEEEKKDPLVEVVPARRDNIARFERSTGRVESHDLADVYAQVTEVATAVMVDVGDEVQTGQVLARLDRGKTELAVAATLIAVQEAELAHRKDNLDAAKRRTDFERIEKYFDPQNPTESKLYSKEAYDAAKLEYDKALNQAQTSRLALDKAQGELAAQQLQLQHTVIQAPISGVIIERNLRPNVLVTSNALAFRIADFSKLEVKLDVAEASLSDLREPARIPSIGLFGLREKVEMGTAQAVLLSVTAFPNARFLGYVDRISPTVDETRGMIVATVRIVQPVEFDAQAHAPLLEQMDPDARKAIDETVKRVQQGESLAIRPGMWVDARISTKVEKNVLLVPGAAMVGDDEVIWVIDTQDAETGTARRIDVSRRRGVNSEGSFELQDAPTKSGKDQEVKEGTLIVVRGQSLLRDGQKVRVRDLTK
jgi:RND family efflux transporter MFP subunit